MTARVDAARVAIRERIAAGDGDGAADVAREALAEARAARDADALDELDRELYALVVADSSAGADVLRRIASEAGEAAAALRQATGPPSPPPSLSHVEPLEGRARVATIGLCIAGAVSVAAIAIDLWQISAVNRLVSEDDVLGALIDLQRSDEWQSRIGLLELGALVAGGVAFLRWFAPAYRNLPALGAPGLRFAPGWAIGAWFVPFLNLWRPKQIANDIWRASQPGAPRSLGGVLQMQPVSRVLTGWWAAWLIGIVLGGFAGAWSDGTEPESLRTSLYLDAAGELCVILAAALAFVVITRVTSAQTQRAARVLETA